jgi:trigger factor
MTEIIIEKTHEDTGSKALSVTVPLERVKQAESRAVNDLSRHARLPGFRKGKVPPAIVRQRYGDAIRQSVLEDVVHESWERVVDTEELTDVIDRSVRNLKFEDDGPIEFEFLVAVKPKLNLERTGGFSLTRTEEPVTQEQIDEHLHHIQEQRATWIPVEGAKPSPGEMVRVEVAPVDGEGAGEAKPYSLVLGEGKAIPALEEKIMELLPGETTETEVSFPEDHPEEDKRGQSRRLRIQLHEVKHQELPPLDDGLAREVGDFEDLAALTAAVQTDLEDSARRDADAKVREQLVSELVAANGVEAPQAMVSRAVSAYAQAYKVPQEQVEKFYQEFQPVAEAQVKRDLVLDAIAETEKLQATEEDIDARIAQIAEARDAKVQDVYAALQKSQRLAEIERALTEEKVFDFLLDQSTIAEAS